jgi:hypothetical protein
VGDGEAASSGAVESTLEYHPWYVWNSNPFRNPVREQYQAGSLTGAVAS